MLLLLLLLSLRIAYNATFGTYSNFSPAMEAYLAKGCELVKGLRTAGKGKETRAKRHGGFVSALDSQALLADGVSE